MSQSVPSLATVKKEKKEKPELTPAQQLEALQKRQDAHAAAEKEKNTIIDLSMAQLALDAAVADVTTVSDLLKALAPLNHIVAEIAKYDAFPAENVSFGTLAALVAVFGTKTNGAYYDLALKIATHKLNLSAFTQHAARKDLNASQHKIVENAISSAGVKLAMDPASRRGFTPLSQAIRAELALTSEARRSYYNLPPKVQAVGADGEVVAKPAPAKRGARTVSDRGDDAAPAAPKKPAAPRKPAAPGTAATTKGASRKPALPATSTPDAPKWGVNDDEDDQN